MPRERFRIHDQAAAEVREAITWFAERDEKLGYWKGRLRDIGDA